MLPNSTSGKKMDKQNKNAQSTNRDEPKYIQSRNQTKKMNSTRRGIKKIKGLTLLPGIDGAVLRNEEDFLQKPENDDSKNPELEPDEVLVGAAHADRPGQAKDDVHCQHQAVEL